LRPLHSISTPQLRPLHRGKVRDSFCAGPDARLLVATDRLSAFDHVLDTAIPGKGAILNQLSAYWFKATEDIVANHLVRVVASQAMIVREVEPIRVEMIVRAFITGSAWRAYAAGQRKISGVDLPNGLTKNQRLAVPIVTPTTKDTHDTEITPAAIIENGLATADVYRQMETAAQDLFAKGAAMLEARGLLLVDTKYEFGLLDGDVVLIDEIHTPDSSRFWAADDYDRDPLAVEAWDKEYVRRWLMDQQSSDSMPKALPENVVIETQRRYAELYERITQSPAPTAPADAASALVRELVAAGVMKDACITLVMGSPRDRDHAATIAQALEPYDVAVRTRIASAHKTPSHAQALAQELSTSIEPGVIIAIAGLSNGLGGALAANTNLPVINCPPFADRTDIALNLASSMMMPSGTPALTVIKPENAALAAIRCLNVPRLRKQASQQMADARQALVQADRDLQEV
jgi:phosphoribosylaminoimidazole-succinocarboxamide synthase